MDEENDEEILSRTISLTKINYWNDELENYAKLIGELSFGYKWMHNSSAEEYSKKQKIMMYASISMGPIIGILLLFNNRKEDSEKSIVYFIAIFLSIVQSVIAAISRFAKFEELSIIHRTFAFKYASLANNIRKQLNLYPPDREIALDYTTWISKNYDELFDMSPPIKNNITKKYENAAISRGIPTPTTGGIDLALIKVAKTPTADKLNMSYTKNSIDDGNTSSQQTMFKSKNIIHNPIAFNRKGKRASLFDEYPKLNVPQSSANQLPNNILFDRTIGPNSPLENNKVSTPHTPNLSESFEYGNEKMKYELGKLTKIPSL